MKPKYKVTGCARFFVFFIIFIPLVFFGAAYMRGENGVQIIKDYYHKIVGKSDSKPSTDNTYDPNERIKELEKELKAANDRIRELEEELKKEKNQN
jgi:hypothetical protein